MNLRNLRVSIFASVLSFISLAGFTGFDFGQKIFKDRDLKGQYGYSFEAEFGPALAQKAVESGVFSADGKGSIEATGTAFVDGTGTVEATYSCTYVVNPDGKVPVECDRTTDAGTFQVKFMLVLVKYAREAHIVGIPSDPPFDVLHLIGSATKQ